MREDEDHIRHTMPVLRRIVILVAVLTAIPVVMWTITAVVRTYVGPPKLPTFQPLTASSVSVAPDDAAAAPAVPAVPVDNPPRLADDGAKADQLPTVAVVTPVDAGGAAPAGGPTSAGVPNAAPVNPAPANATPAAPAAKAAAGKAANSARINVASDGATASPPNIVAQFAPEQQQPAAAAWPQPPSAAEAAPSGEPIAGPVPLPRKRPKSVTVAQASVPLPRQRPEEAGPPAPESIPTPLDWLHNIFQPPSLQHSAPASAEPDASPDETTSPH